MAETRVDPAVLRASSGEYDGHSAAIKGALSTIGGVVEASQGAFQGPAAVAFRTSANNQINAANSLNATLAAIGQAIHAAGGRYDAQEADATQGFTTLRNL